MRSGLLGGLALTVELGLAVWVGTDHGLLAAGSLLVGLPTIVVFLLLQRHLIAGLTPGSTKG